MLFLAQMTTFFFLSNLWIVLLMVILFLPLNAMSIAISHNHHHLPTFKKPILNSIYELILSLQNGATPKTWILHHTIGHHVNFMDQKKDTSPWQHRDGTTMTRTEYVLINTLMMYPETFRTGKRKPKLFRDFKIHLIPFFIILAALIAYSPLKASIVFIIPMILMLFLVVDATYLHHKDLETDNVIQASRNNMNKWFNRFTWNLGYHAAHHAKPGLHWSKLPEYHESIKHEIPDELLFDRYDWSHSDKNKQKRIEPFVDAEQQKI